MDKDWTAGISCEELSKRKWYFERGVGTCEELLMPMHTAGACSRIATALERIADLMDPEVRARKAANKKRDEKEIAAEARAREIVQRHWPGKGRTQRTWDLVLWNAILDGIDITDLREVARWAPGRVRYIGKKTGERLLAEAEQVMGSGGGAK